MAMKKRSTLQLAAPDFARFMRAAISSRPSPHVDTSVAPAFAEEWRAFTADVIASLATMPQNERTAFATAIRHRAREWSRTPAGETPRAWPIAVRVERSPVD